MTKSRSQRFLVSVAGARPSRVSLSRYSRATALKVFAALALAATFSSLRCTAGFTPLSSIALACRRFSLASASETVG